MYIPPEDGPKGSKHVVGTKQKENKEIKTIRNIVEIEGTPRRNRMQPSKTKIIN
jgi:hypothetical protein